MTRNVIGLLGIGFFLLGFDVNWERLPLVQVEDVVTDRGWPILGEWKEGESMGISRLSHSDRDRNVKVLNSVLELT